MKNRTLSFLTAAILVLAGSLPALAQSSHGPKEGSLILTGGDFGTGVIKRFVELAGGTTAKIVYIPTGGTDFRLPSGARYNPSEWDNPSASSKDFQQELSKAFGVDNITVLHTRFRSTADSDSFVADLRQASGVWLGGGNQGLLAKAYLGTKTQRELVRVLERGGVVGGNSAGAMMLGSYLIRGREDKPVLMAKDYDRGFGFMTNVAINTFLTEQKRALELISVVDAYPNILGIGIDERAAIVVKGDHFEVLGDGRVAIYDNVLRWDSWYYWLRPGERFDLIERKKSY